MTTLTQEELDHCARTGYDPARFAKLKTAPKQYGAVSMAAIEAALRPDPEPSIAERIDAQTARLEARLEQIGVRMVSAPTTPVSPPVPLAAAARDDLSAELDRLGAQIPSMTPDQLRNLERMLEPPEEPAPPPRIPRTTTPPEPAPPPAPTGPRPVADLLREHPELAHGKRGAK